MAVLVSLLGAAMLFVGVIGLVRPERLAALVEHWSSPARYRFAVVVRFLIGAFLIVAAPACRMPGVVRAVGVLAIAAAVALLFLGRARLDAFVRWWLAHPSTIRPAGLFAAAFGSLLMSAGF